jgi:hypothetical protein
VQDSAPAIRRLCIAVDVVPQPEATVGGRAAGRRPAVREPGAAESSPDPSPDSAQVLSAVLTEASRRADLDRGLWCRPPDGPGEVAVLPPGIDEDRVVVDVIRELQAVVRGRVRSGAEVAGSRLCVAVHQGITRTTETGYSGRAVLWTRRLLAAAAGHGPRVAANLALIFSADLFEDLTHDERPVLRRADFRPVLVAGEDPGASLRAWLTLRDVR